MTNNRKIPTLAIFVIVLLSLSVSADHPKPYINEPISIKVVNISGTYNFTYYYDNGVLIAEEDQTGKKLFYHPDHLGSTTLITNESGEEVETIFYLPFGDLDNTDTDKRYLYTGKEKDKETGLYYYGARYYDTDLMTFITPEQDIPNLYNPQDLNHYTYVRNNPYKYVDPSGEFVDTALDDAFIVSDVAILIDDPSTENAVALGLDVAGAVIPFITGVGKIYKISKVGKAIDKAEDVAQVSEKGKAVSKAVDKTTEGLKSSTKGNFRENVGRLTGAPLSKTEEAHHILPQKFEKNFNKADLNIHEPQYGTRVDKITHREISYQYNKDWKNIFKKTPHITKEQIIAKAKELADKYKKIIIVGVK